METATLDLHVDGSGERFAPGVTEGAAPPPPASRNAAGAALDAEWRAIDTLTLAASGRLDRWSTSSLGTVDDARPTGHLGLETTALPGVTLAAHGGATARPASFVELYGDRGTFLGDPGLRPESAWTVDAGARTGLREGPFRLAAEVASFATWATDLITFVPVGAYGRFKATNIGQARLLGVEADVRASAGPLEVRAAYTGLETENGSACEAVVGPCQHPPLPGRPTHDLVADAIVALGPASVRVGVDALTGMVTDQAGAIGVPPRVLTSAGVRVDVARGVRLALEGRNLLDVRTGTYEGALGPVREPIGDFYEYPLPGRSFLASVRVSSRAEGP